MQLYSNEERLLETVAGYVEAGVRRGEGVVVIMKPGRREALAEWLTERGHDLRGLRGSGAYIDLDAKETLGRFLVGGAPDAEPIRRGGVSGP